MLISAHDFSTLARHHLTPNHDGSLTQERVGAYRYTYIHHHNGRRPVAVRIDRVRNGAIVETAHLLADDADAGR